MVHNNGGHTDNYIEPMALHGYGPTELRSGIITANVIEPMVLLCYLQMVIVSGGSMGGKLIG